MLKIILIVHATLDMNPSDSMVTSKEKYRALNTNFETVTECMDYFQDTWLLNAQDDVKKAAGSGWTLTFEPHCMGVLG